MFLKKIVLHRQLADLGVELLDLLFVVPGLDRATENAWTPVSQAGWGPAI